MADLYLVTTEDEDGMWFDDPDGFDSEQEARDFAEKRPPPTGKCFGIYSCRLIDIVGKEA